MFSKVIAAALAAVACAQTTAELESYPNYASPFANFNLTWESIKVKTDDGWTLTVFHITGDTNTGPFEITKPAVLMQHAMGTSGVEWIASYQEKEPLAFQLARMGFDVYITNNSGVQYSQENDQYTYNDPEFWMMDWRKWGVYDIPAAVRMIRTRNGGAKVALVGHSQGTT